MWRDGCSKFTVGVGIGCVAGGDAGAEIFVVGPYDAGSRVRCGGKCYCVANASPIFLSFIDLYYAARLDHASIIPLF